MCLDVLFCTASIMHLCTISVDRYLSLRYPMKFGRNKTRKRVVLKIMFVWFLSVAMSLPLSLMYFQDYDSVLVRGTCQIPDPLFKLIGSIVCFYVPLVVMMITYALTVRLLEAQQQSLGPGPGWTGMWLSSAAGQAMGIDRRCTWKRFIDTKEKSDVSTTQQNLINTQHSNASTESDLTTLENHELWLPDTSVQETTSATMTALHVFGAEMLKLSRGLESFAVGREETQNSER
ncbi:class A rhodopsin-like G-protein coupled receptor GPR5ht4, putative [Pediculus humanus corporis]|uniref:Class A rhodopsin-like G-protein coupled receptor GPR5ht4, putative n=1 Tax=Pediculus humanus subsp. corporis TaxID=121224 RepID=E0VTY6_PEDHC|nr:class A rhodopsin-like G-protein coupled receptor GPR5ht4, putative [Pediculus humanus corporis]EEB16842.1 class A rhodopsin-like G-protein coupled receptor GPR5ht4, putative [Pediculus humanus corporis]